jgi:hypothetical protein
MGAQKAILENLLNGGIALGGRKIRLEIAKSTSKIVIRTSLDEADFVDTVKKYQKAFEFSIWVGKSDGLCQSVNLKFEDSKQAASMVELLHKQNAHWHILDSLKHGFPTDNPKMIAEFAQRQSGLFQLKIPESGVLPVPHSALAKINGLLSDIQYSVTAQVPLSVLGNQSFPALPLQSSPLGIINRRFEDMRIDEEGSTSEALYTDPVAAKENIITLSPLLGKFKKSG